MKRENEVAFLSDFTEEELELIKKALTVVVERRVEKVKSLPDAPFELSDEFNQKMQTLIDENGKK